LKNTGELHLHESQEKDGKFYDVFGTANFFNFYPFATSIEYLFQLGLENIQKYNDNLINKFIKELDQKKYRFISPTAANQRSALIVISHVDVAKNQSIYRKLINKNI